MTRHGPHGPVGSEEHPRRRWRKAVANALKLAAPLKEGPMRDLDHWLDAFAPTYVKRLDQDRIRKALEGATMIGQDMPTSMFMHAGPTVPAPIGLAPGGGGQPTIIIHQHIVGSVVTKDDLTREIRDGIISTGQGLTRTF